VSRQLYEAHVARLVLDLREALVRHDDNLAAWKLMSEAVPWFIADHPEISRQREEQRQMCLHLIDPDAYAAYYGSNPHERPFEEQFAPATVDDAHLYFHRLAFLRAVLDRMLLAGTRAPSRYRILDVSCNDGAFAANLALAGWTCDGMDLNPDCIARARLRKGAFPKMGEFEVGDFTVDPLLGGRDVVACLETIEHVADPDEAMRDLVALCKPTGRIVISTPNSVDHGGDLPNWDHVEPKGHVRVFTPKTFHELLSRHGTVERMEQGPDGVMVAEVSL
jgi:2-polyprenyl-3-methyl-5-hydroxy-6-metoxy-1,4-benzoquinol methylase